jgi:TPR repeat protein
MALSSSEDKPVNPEELPKPELNPLLNPTLGQNLGRWAQVYFTTPTEKRDQAVIELLRELESESARPAAPPSSPPRENGPSAAAPVGDPSRIPQPATVTSSLQPAVTASAEAAEAPTGSCLSCGAKNDANQHFCGLCGTPLSDGHESFDPAATAGKLAAGLMARESDIDWLRNSVPVSYDDPDVEPRAAWVKYAVVGVVLLLAGIGAMELLSHMPTKNAAVSKPVNPAALPTAPSPSSQTASAFPAAAAPAQAPAMPGATANATPPETPEVLTEPKSSSNAKQTAPFGIENAADRQAAGPGVANGPVASGNGDNGMAELQQAQAYLEGRKVPHDSVQAARLLWKAVAKENIAATLLLADMYLQGDGVTQSCDQARLLLVAASEKGSAEAAAKLRSLESTGCR